MKKFKLRRTFSLALSLVLLAAAAGCNTTTVQDPSPAGSTGAEAPAAGGEGAVPTEPGSLPITTEPITLSMFVRMDSKAARTITNFNEMDAFQEYEARTGIHIDFQHPAGAGSSEVTEAFNLMIASNTLTDLISYTWLQVPGGLDKLVNDGQLLRLNELQEEHAVHLTKVFQEYPEFKTDSTTYEGNIVLMPSARLDPVTRYFESFIIRQDWLDKLGLEHPTNIDEWYDVLTAFKTQDPNGNGIADEIPFVSNTNEQMGIYRFGCLFGINPCWYFGKCFYVEDGTVKFTPLEPAFMDYVGTMNQWYSEGLIDLDYLTSDAESVDNKVLNNLGGAFFGKMNAGIGTYLGSMQDKDPEFNLMPVAYPTASDGKSYDFYSSWIADGGGLAISASCQYPVEAVRWADYMYSEEGILLTNFGIEGLTYEIRDDGLAYYTELVTNDPDGLSLVNAICRYCPAGIGPRLVNDGQYFKEVTMFEQQRMVYPTVSEGSTRERQIPQNLTYSADDTAKLASILNEIQTYYEENTNAFIMGTKDMSEYDDFRQTLLGMNIEEAIAIQQEAYDRYIRN